MSLKGNDDHVNRVLHTVPELCKKQWDIKKIVSSAKRKPELCRVGWDTSRDENVRYRDRILKISTFRPSGPVGPTKSEKFSEIKNFSNQD